MVMIFKKILITASMLVFGALSLAPAYVSALDCSNPQTTQDQIQCGANDASGNNGKKDASTSIDNTIKSIVNLLSVAVGVIAVIMIIVGGFRYITSGGKQDSVASAKNTILYAVIGLVVVALAQVIVRFVLTNVTKPK